MRGQRYDYFPALLTSEGSQIDEMFENEKLGMECVMSCLLSSLCEIICDVLPKCRFM